MGGGWKPETRTLRAKRTAPDDSLVLVAEEKADRDHAQVVKRIHLIRDSPMQSRSRGGVKVG